MPPKAQHGGESPPRSLAARLAILPFILLIRAYQATLRPFMGGQCRFYPTCSDYGLEAYRTHGAIRGTFLTARRILRCRPWGGSGYDPVPPAPPPLPAGEVSRVRE